MTLDDLKKANSLEVKYTYLSNVLSKWDKPMVCVGSSVIKKEGGVLTDDDWEAIRKVVMLRAESIKQELLRMGVEV